MIHFTKTFFILLIATMFVAGCDIVEEPYLVPTGGSGPGPGENVKKVLLEDFTGQKCPNCPEAAALANNLKTIYGEQLVLLTVHAGFYSVPDASGNFTADYRTTVGNDLNSYFPFLGYPSGMVDRAEYKGSVVLFKDDWEDAVATQVELPAEASIIINSEYNAASRQLSCTTESTFLESLTGTYNICVFLTESGIVSPQQTETGVNENYVHNHVLRASLNGTWGEPVGETGTAAANAKLTDTFEITLDNAWNAENCGIVVFIYNTESLEIIQAEEVEVME